MTTTYISCKKVRVNGRLPTRATDGSAGWDLYSAENVYLGPGERKLVSCGIALEIPDGYSGNIRPRSGLAGKYGITVINSPGTVDSDYRGTIFVPLINHNRESGYKVKTGDRIAQIIFERVLNISLVEVTELNPSIRDNKGFGSTGV